MDEFTQELLALAYESVKKRRGETMNVATLKRQMWRHWMNYRDGTLATWAAQTFERVPHRKLASLVDTVLDLLGDAALYADLYSWEYPPEHSDDEDDTPIAEWVAWGLATLRWHHCDLAGRFPVPNATDAEIAAWIAQRETRQLPLWALAG